MLKHLHILLIAIVFAGTAAAGADQPASADSVRKLLEVTPEKRVVIDHMRGRRNGVVNYQASFTQQMRQIQTETQAELKALPAT